MRIALVDIYGAGRELAKVLLGRGHDVVHVLSAPVVHPFYSGVTGDSNTYSATFDAATTPNPGILLGTYSPDFVLPGSELGVVQSAELAAELGVRGNDPTAAQIGSDKATLYAHLDAAGLRSPNGDTFSSPMLAVAWANGQRIGEFVVKPRSSAGGDGVMFCSSLGELELHARRLLARESNALGRAEDEILVQERISGVEYYINLVSFGGVHKVSDIWQYTKTDRNGCPVYDYEMFVDPSDERWSGLATAARAVLDAVGVSDGAAHLEVFDTGDEFVVVDLGLRLGGGNVPSVLRDHGLMPQVDLLVLGIEDPDGFKAWDERGNKLDRSLVHFAGIAHHQGPFRPQSVAELSGLPTCVFAAPNQEAGQIEPTRDLFTAPTMGYLSGSGFEEILRDLATIREWERSGIYYTAVGV